MKTSVSKPSALSLRFLKGSHPCFPVAPRRPRWSPRRWRASRRASPFLSLSHLSTCAQVRELNSCTIIYILAGSGSTSLVFLGDDAGLRTFVSIEDCTSSTTEVVETVLHSRALSTRKLSLKWIVYFMVWKS